MKPKSKLLTADPLDVKILCTLWYEFCYQDKILYRTSKEVDEEWRLVIPQEKHTEILSLLYNRKTAGYPGMSLMKLTVSSRFYWPRMRYDIENWIKCC